MMVMTERRPENGPSEICPERAREAQSERLAVRARLATNHLMRSQYRAQLNDDHQIDEPLNDAEATAMMKNERPEIPGDERHGRPVKLEIRPPRHLHAGDDPLAIPHHDPRRRDDEDEPEQSTIRLRQVKSQDPEIDRKRAAAMAAAAASGGAPVCGIAGGARRRRRTGPGISPAFCQPAMPSVQTSVSAADRSPER